MHIEFLSLTKALNVPLLSGDDCAALNRLQKQWEHWAQREAPARSGANRHGAAGGLRFVPRQSDRRERATVAGAYYANLLGDDIVAKSYIPQVAHPGIIDVQIRSLAEFDLHETVILPENGEKLIGFVAHPSGLADAMRYLVPAAEYDEAEPSAIPPSFVCKSAILISCIRYHAVSTLLDRQMRTHPKSGPDVVTHF